MSTIYSLFFLIWTIICSEQAKTLQEGEVCAPDGSKCTNLENCTILHDEANRGEKPLLCDIKGKDIIVCCSPQKLYKFSDPEVPISSHACQWYMNEVCEEVKAHSAVEEGRDQTRSFFEEKTPFMAKILYRWGSIRKWACAGILISRRHILAPAECTKNEFGYAQWVEFENDDITDINSLYTIIQRFNHPRFDRTRRYHSIALYLLDRPVQFSALVRPICLPQIYSDYESSRTLYSTAGWKFENGRPQVAGNEVKIVPTGSCEYTGKPRNFPDGIDFKELLCAEVSNGHSPSDCTGGYSGGPLYTRDFPTCDSGTLLGLLSLGQFCGDTDFTGIFSNITDYRPWIESYVWPESSTYAEAVRNN